MKLVKTLCILVALGSVEAAFAQFKSKLKDLKNSLESGLEDNLKAPQNLDSLKNDVRKSYDELKEYFKSLEEKFDKTRDFGFVEIHEGEIFFHKKVISEK